MAFLASGVKLNDSLKAPVRAIGSRAKSGLEDALSRIQTRSTEGQVVSGRPQGGYAASEIGRAGEVSGRELEDSLYGALATGAYKDRISQKKFDQDMALAEEIGAINAPSAFDQVVGGIGNLVGAAGKFKGLYDALGSSKAPAASGGGSLPPSLSLFNNNASGIGRYLSGF